jgi:hypothetical protein
MVGIVFNFTSSGLHNTNDIGYICYNGEVRTLDSNKPYDSARVGAGDVITVFVDIGEGKRQMKFKINDKECAIMTIPDNGKLYPTVSLCNSGDSIKISNISSW